MNDKLVPVLETLAVKFQTSVEYLWVVLVKQAFISGITDILQYILLTIGIVYLVKFSKAVILKREEFSEGEALAAGILGTTVWVFTGILVISAFLNLPDTVAAFVNPEFWALDYLLERVKSK